MVEDNSRSYLGDSEDVGVIPDGNIPASELERRESAERLLPTVIDGLNKAYVVHESLGVDGEEMVQKNQFGDTALRVDIEAERVILDFLRDSNIPIRVISEEHGTTEISDNPRYLGIIDGLDGTGVYKSERGVGRYGTMFGIFDSIDPSYGDYLVSGVMEHSTGRLFVAFRGGGAYVIENGEAKPIRSSGQKSLRSQSKIYIDEYFDINIETFSEKLKDFNTECKGSSCVYYVDVASGEADLALECTRKNNLEIAISYGLEKEAGAVIVDLEGNDIGDNKYLEFGQTEQLPIVTAATHELAEDLIRHIKPRPQSR